jgi:hypothetical protein
MLKSSESEVERKSIQALTKWANHYASTEEAEEKAGIITDIVAPVQDLRLNVALYSSYATYCSARRMELYAKLTAFASVLLAVSTILAIFIR